MGNRRENGGNERNLPVITGSGQTGRTIASPTPVGIFPFSRISIGDGIDVHGVRIMSRPAHVTGRLGARVMRRGGHGRRSLSRGTVEEHLVEEKTEGEDNM